MNAITIHGIDETVAAEIRQRAKKDGESINKFVKRLLAEAVGMKPKAAGRHRSEFEAFAGAWSAADVREFEKRNAGFDRIDRGDWK